MRLEEYKKESLKDQDFREAYKKKNLEDKIAYIVEESRIKSGLTQEELADKMDTKQASISRVENGKCLPSLKFLEKMAEALNAQLKLPYFISLDEKKKQKVG